MIIAIDFDGTIVEHKYPHIGKPLPGAFETISQLYADGHRIIIWTCRGGQELVCAIEYLHKNGVPFDRVNENVNYEIIGFKPAPKIYADIYIDDKNLGGFPGWEKTYEIISTMEQPEFNPNLFKDLVGDENDTNYSAD